MSSLLVFVGFGSFAEIRTMLEKRPLSKNVLLGVLFGLRVAIILRSRNEECLRDANQSSYNFWGSHKLWS